MLNRYFLKIKNTNDFIESFVKLPDDVMKSIISRNYHLFQYIMIMMAEVEKYITQKHKQMERSGKGDTHI
jgi:hypothetical protein